jgi:hypothetical protein
VPKVAASVRLKFCPTSHHRFGQSLSNQEKTFSDLHCPLKKVENKLTVGACLTKISERLTGFDFAMTG